MCGILCLYNKQRNVLEDCGKFNQMLHLLEHRGPDDSRTYFDSHVLLGHCRLSIIDLKGGKQPFEYTYQGKIYRIIFNGEIYNMNELKKHLIDLGFHFSSQSDSEVLLVCFIAYREKCLNMLDGIFSFVIYYDDQIFACRDHLGVKPLYYYLKENDLIIASEIKAILMYLGKCVVDKTGIKELLGLGPSLSPGKTLYKDISSLRPAHYLFYDGNDCIIDRYWGLQKKPHLKSYEETVQDVRYLVNQSIQRQLLSDVPISCMLSGGLDSSIITALSSQYVNNISTYSIDYLDQEKYFKPYDYQLTRDSDYIDEMVERYHSHHNNVVLSQKNLIIFLKQSMIARDAPGMADIDSSFLLFCKEIKRHHKVVLSGECADEIFGGYPWFYKKELYSLDTFPWIRDIDQRLDLLNENISSIKLSPIFIVIVSFCFSMTIGVLWEFFEYGADNILKTDMQKDSIVQNISTVTLDKTKSNKAIGINNIKYTVIYSEDNEGKMNETIIPNGYLDIGINDTMKDLMVNFIGAICFSVFGYLYIINRGKYHFVNNFIARKISN